MNNKSKVIIAGGGFAGVQIARKLDNDLFDVLLIDKVNHHQFQPLFYQVATAQIEPSSISFPLRHIFRKKRNMQIRLAEIISVDHLAKNVHTSIGNFDYDFLVLALGCQTNFFGNQELREHALTLKSSCDAISVRNHILRNFEKTLSAGEEEKVNLMNLVIVGGGPTGVELAGAFSEIRKNILPKDYHGFDFSKLRIILVEGSKNLLNNMSQTAKSVSGDCLRKMGVEVLTETIVKSYNGNELQLANGEKIKTETVIWAAGVTPNIIQGLPSDSVAQDHRLIVDRVNKVSGCDHIYAIGDMARMLTPRYPRGHPQVANVAVNQAKNLAKNLKNIKQGKELTEYEYKDLGTMATLGRNKAVVDLPSRSIKGFFAWLIWMLLHLMLILSVKNKLLIFMDWAWTYITKDTSLRLILKENK